MKYLSLFAGIGGFERGIEEAYEEKNSRLVNQTGQVDTVPSRQEAEHGAGVGDIHARGSGNGPHQSAPTCVGYSEIDKYAVQIYQSHFPEHTNYGDITQIDPSNLPDFELLVGGFPCQAFSIAGKRGGFTDTRGTLFFEIARIVREKQPRLLLLENVKGLLSHDQGRTFATIIRALDELGYDLQWQVINSKNHGVPQNRERVFIVGHSRNTPRPQVFPLGETTRATDEGLEPRDTPLEVASTIRSRYGNGSGSHIKQLNQPKHSNDRVYGTEGVSPTLNTMQGGRRQPFVKVPEASIRRLTPTECERLQGFPDGWTKYGRDEKKALQDAKGYYTKETVWDYPILKHIKKTVRHDEPLVEISDTQRYKVLGNAVTVNVIRDIMTNLIKI